jgi:hypothetical protein
MILNISSNNDPLLLKTHETFETVYINTVSYLRNILACTSSLTHVGVMHAQTMCILNIIV